MKAAELVKLLEQYPDFEVVLSIRDGYALDGFPSFSTVSVVGIEDVGHSDKVIFLDAEEATHD